MLAEQNVCRDKIMFVATKYFCRDKHVFCRDNHVFLAAPAIEILGTGPQDGHLDFHTAPEL